MSDTYDLQRFVTAQRPVYPAVLAELRAGRKRSHWMWFVFPQLRGLGSSATAQRYGIGSRAEAQGYLAHPVLGTRLRECAGLLLAVPKPSAREVLGYPDDLKLRSSMTLFAAAAADAGADGTDFVAVLDAYFGGGRDERTVEIWATLH